MIRYLGFLKHIPLVPWVADGLMAFYNYFFNPELIHAIARIEQEVSQWKGITARVHRFGGLQFDLHGLEIGHIHSNGIVDIMLGSRLKSIVLLQYLAEDHHTLKNSGWITYRMNRLSDADQALYLFGIGYERLESQQPTVDCCR